MLRAIAAAAISACTQGPTTWHQDIAPILAEHCMSCHREGGLAPFALTDYESARDHAQRMVYQIESGAMPPFGVREDADCTPRHGWAGDPRLSARELARLREWIELGHPVGSRVAPPAIPSRDLPEVNVTLTPVVGWEASGDRDQLVCYVLDPEVATERWLTGLQVRPGNPAIVHHATIFAVSGQPAIDFVAEHGIGRPFLCGGGVAGDYQIHAWFPGNQPLVLPEGMAMRLVPDVKIVVQVHYHPHGEVHGPDTTSIDLRVSDHRPSKLYATIPLGNEIAAPRLLPGPADTTPGQPEFRIPANAREHFEHIRIPLVGSRAQIVSVIPHMHLVGTRMWTTIERGKPRGGEPRSECLQNSRWDFDWQQTYSYDATIEDLPSLGPGDVIDIKCTWDNTLGNPFMYRLLADRKTEQPVDLTMGEATTDEMCLEYFGIIEDLPR